MSKNASESFVSIFIYFYKNCFSQRDLMRTNQQVNEKNYFKFQLLVSCCANWSKHERKKPTRKTIAKRNQNTITKIRLALSFQLTLISFDSWIALILLRSIAFHLCRFFAFLLVAEFTFHFSLIRSFIWYAVFRVLVAVVFFIFFFFFSFFCVWPQRYEKKNE